MRTHHLWILLSVALPLPGCGSNHERQAEWHLRMARRDYLISGALGHLEAASRLSSDPRYRLALSVTRFEEFIIQNTSRSSVPPGAAGEPDFREVLRLDPRCAAAHFYLGQILMMRQDPKAEAHFLMAAAVDPVNALPLYIAAAMRAGRGDEVGALKLVQQGNARKSLRLYLSAAQDAAVGGGGDIMMTFHWTAELRTLARYLTVYGHIITPLSSPPGFAVRLLRQGKTKDALDACEAVWQMGKKVSRVEPPILFISLAGHGEQSIALAGLRQVAPALGDPRVTALVAFRQQAHARLRQFKEANIKGANINKDVFSYFAVYYARRWGFSVLAALLALAFGVCAFLSRRLRRIALVAGAVACVWLGLAICVVAEGYMAPAAMFPDRDARLVRRMVQMIP